MLIFSCVGNVQIFCRPCTGHGEANSSILPSSSTGQSFHFPTTPRDLNREGGKRFLTYRCPCVINSLPIPGPEPIEGGPDSRVPLHLPLPQPSFSSRIYLGREAGFIFLFFFFCFFFFNNYSCSGEYVLLLNFLFIPLLSLSIFSYIFVCLLATWIHSSVKYHFKFSF